MLFEHNTHIKGICPFYANISGTLTRDTSLSDAIILIDYPTFTMIHSLQNVKGIVCTKPLSPYCHELLLLKDLHIPLIYSVGETANELIGQEVTIIGDNQKGFILKGSHKNKSTEKILSKKYAMTSTITGMKYYIKHNATTVATRSEFMLLPVLKQHPLSVIHQKGGKTLIYNAIYNTMKFACSNFRRAIYRFSDFSEESLSHFSDFEIYEKREHNPALGNRGAYRLLHAHKKIFQIELQVIADLSKEFNNIEVLFPYVRTLQEAKELLSVSRKKISKNVHAGCMIEVPSLIFQAKSLDMLFDFFIVGTKDLSQLLYGFDRNSIMFSSQKDSIIAQLLHENFLQNITKNKRVYVTSKDVYNTLKEKYDEYVISLND